MKQIIIILVVVFIANFANAQQQLIIYKNGSSTGEYTPLSQIDSIKFGTLPNITLPTVITSAASVASTTSASGGGNVTSDGGATVTARGVCWGTSSGPVVAGNHTTDGTGTGVFTSIMTGLTLGTTYYIKAYATNSAGTAYGSEVSVTIADLPVVTTNNAVQTSSTTATCGGNVGYSGATVTACGVCWSTSQNPTTSDSHTTDATGVGSFSSSITGLSVGTYYVRAYAVTNNGTAYGAQVTLIMTNSTLFIGQTYAGGVIFYIDGTGQHGLVCAPTNGGWCSFGQPGTITGAGGTAVGTGAANTTAIIASGLTATGNGANICNDLVSGGYSDWFMPSKDELQLMLSNLCNPGIPSQTFWGQGTYMCSTVTYDATVNCIDFYYGAAVSWYTQDRSQPIKVWAVRTF